MVVYVPKDEDQQLYYISRINLSCAFPFFVYGETNDTVDSNCVVIDRSIFPSALTLRDLAGSIS